MDPRRVLVAYITQDGYTRVVARAIAQRLRDAELTVDVADLELSIRHPRRYDAIVLACAVHRRHHAVALADWIEDNRDALAARTTALITIDRRAQANRHTANLSAATRWRPGYELVLEPVGEPLRRRVMRELRGGPPQPHPSIELDKIHAFADALAPIIRSAPPRADLTESPAAIRGSSMRPTR